MAQLHGLMVFVLSLFWDVDLAYSACGVDDSFQPFGQKAYKVQTSSANQATHKATCEATAPGKFSVSAIKNEGLGTLSVTLTIRESRGGFFIP